MAGGTIQPLDIVRDDTAFALRPSDYVLSRSLAASTAESFTVPTSPRARFVLFSSNVDFYANWTTTATVPGDVTDGSASELNPSMRFIPNDCTAISVISPDAGVVTASFWRD